MTAFIARREVLVISERGFAGASLEAIARRAGVTRGSIYSNFSGRDDLMIAAVASQGTRLDGDFKETLPLVFQLRRFAEALLAQSPAGARDGGLIIEYQLYAMSQPALRSQLAAAYGDMFGKMTASLAVQYEGQLAMSAHALALAVHALTIGLIWQFMLTPGEVRRGGGRHVRSPRRRGARPSEPISRHRDCCSNRCT